MGCSPPFLGRLPAPDAARRFFIAGQFPFLYAVSRNSDRKSTQIGRKPLQYEKGEIKMSQETTVNKPKRSYYAALGIVFGAGTALLLSVLGLEMEMSVGMVLGLCIGTAFDKNKRE